jgi:hypothetical protein
VPAAELETLQDSQRAGGQYADDETVYRVLHVSEADAVDRKIPPGKYLVNGGGKLVYFVDPAINGRLKKRDDGGDLHANKFSAPKTQLMAKIINGIFDQKLPWGLVLLGVLIAITLELSGVPSLPFAVGVYLPLESSTPIFLGGAVRWLVDWAAKVRGRSAASETESEMSPGTLLSTGYIAGASIAGVICAFVAASPTATAILGRFQYRTHILSASMPLEKAFEEVAKTDLGPDAKEEAIKEKAGEVAEINDSDLPNYSVIPVGTELVLPDGSKVKVEKETNLADFVKSQNNPKITASGLFNANSDTLKLPKTLPAGAVLNIPQRDMTAVAVSGAMVLFLLLVGMGFFLKPATPTTQINGVSEGEID